MYKVKNGNTRGMCDMFKSRHHNLLTAKSRKYFSRKGFKLIVFPADIYLLKINDTNTRTRSQICSKLAINTSERRQASFWYFYVNFEHISHLVVVFLLLALNMTLPAGLCLLV